MRRILIASFLLTIGAGPVRAQEVPARLTLEDALRIARTYSPAFRQAANDLDVAAAQQRQAFGSLLPTVNANLSFNGSHSRALTGRGNFDEVITNPEYVETTNSSASQGIGLSVTLFDGGANLDRVREGKASARAIEARVDVQAVQLRFDVATRYYAVLQAQRRVSVEERLLASAQEQRTLTQRRFEIGAARREDVLGAEAQVATQQQQVEQARGNARKTRLAFLGTMGVEHEVAFEPVDEPIGAFDPASLDAAALVEAALTTSPRILERQANVAARERSSSIARGTRWPRITASASLSRSVGRPEYEALFELDPPNRSVGFGISASLPIFSGFQTSYNIANADAQLADAREQLRGERMTLEVEVRSALIDLENAYRSLELAERSLALGQERLELTEERYRIGGTVPYYELQNAIDGAARAERQAIDARFNFVNALINLEAKVGREVRP